MYFEHFEIMFQGYVSVAAKNVERARSNVRDVAMNLNLSIMQSPLSYFFSTYLMHLWVVDTVSLFEKKQELSKGFRFFLQLSI